MPEILKTNGQTDYPKIFMGFAASLVLVLQQWQTYKIANELQKRMDAMEDGFISKGELPHRFSAIDDRLDIIEKCC